MPVCAPLINNTKENDIEESNNKSNHIISVQATNVSAGYDCDMISEMDVYEEIIKENIAYCVMKRDVKYFDVRDKQDK